ncbi:MAG: DUF928 domain-containing protein [Geminicoccaceae bacterium]
MTANKSILVSSLVAFAILAASLGHAEEKAASDSQAPALSESEIAESLKKLIFVPHDAGAPEITDAGGVRAITVRPKIELLAPEKMARTLSPTPTLYWHISKPAPGPVRFTLLKDDATTIDPLLDFQIDGIDQEGIYGVSLHEHGLSLEDGHRYIWSIALSPDGENYGTDLAAQTVMEHKSAATFAKALQDARPEERAIRLAAGGYWYDAVDTLSDQIFSNKPLWQAARGRLLDQAGLLQAARYDRQQSSK